jgi:hypothetical protein
MGWLRNDARRPAAVAVSSTRCIAWPAAKFGASAHRATAPVWWWPGPVPGQTPCRCIHGCREPRRAVVPTVAVSAKATQKVLVQRVAGSVRSRLPLTGALPPSMLLLPIVRGTSPLQTGLLMIPQGLGDACAITLAGRLIDELGARRVVPVGVLIALAGTAAYTQIGQAEVVPAEDTIRLADAVQESRTGDRHLGARSRMLEVSLVCWSPTQPPRLSTGRGRSGRSRGTCTV